MYNISITSFSYNKQTLTFQKYETIAMNEREFSIFLRVVIGGIFFINKNK